MKQHDFFESGAQFARSVQAGLAEGKTFEELKALPPEQAARIREIARAQGDVDEFQFWDGYVSSFAESENKQ